MIAIVATGMVATIVYRLTTVGMVLCLCMSIGVRYYFKRRADRHEKKHHIDIAQQSGESAGETDSPAATETQQTSEPADTASDEGSADDTASEAE